MLTDEIHNNNNLNATNNMIIVVNDIWFGNYDVYLLSMNALCYLAKRNRRDYRFIYKRKKEGLGALLCSSCLYANFVKVGQYPTFTKFY